ncbi:MAG TPA: hypothetical protein VKB49_25110 [Candidatus Sulfotelmatobacter sp.]|nr:hypothetical protein [Candidatus Sulfotelmatobacter sp.]
MALSRNQANTVKALKEMVEQGQPVCRETLALAHREGYFHLKDADSSVVSDYVAKNLKSQNFIAALGFDCQAIKQHLGDEILRNLRGENPIFEKNLDIYLDSLKIAARLAFEEKSTVTIRDDYSGRSDEDLQYFIDHGKWRE